MGLFSKKEPKTLAEAVEGTLSRYGMNVQETHPDDMVAELLKVVIRQNERLIQINGEINTATFIMRSATKPN